MVNRVGIRLGLYPPERVEDTMTIARIELENQWLQRDEARALQLQTAAVKRAIGESFGG